MTLGESAAVGAVPVAAAVAIALTYTSTEVLSILAAVGVLVGVVGGVVVNIIMAVRKKVEESNAKLATIEGHVNSQASASKAENDGLREEIRLLREVMEGKDQAAALLAQAKVAEVSVSASLPTEHLQAIEEHTNETAKNTKKTDTVVQALKHKKK